MRSCCLTSNRRWCRTLKEPEIEYTIFSSSVHLPISNLVIFLEGKWQNTLCLWRLTFLCSISLRPLHAVSSSSWRHAEWREKVLLGHHLISVSLTCWICPGHEEAGISSITEALCCGNSPFFLWDGREKWCWFHIGHSLPGADASGQNHSKRWSACESWQDWL